MTGGVRYLRSRTRRGTRVLKQLIPDGLRLDLPYAYHCYETFHSVSVHDISVHYVFIISCRVGVVQVFWTGDRRSPVDERMRLGGSGIRPSRPTSSFHARKIVMM